jgi:phosphohistidine phosphatase SixA
MVIAHNPGLSMLVHELQPVCPLHMPTSCACVLKANDGQLLSGMPLVAFLTPKSLKESGYKNAQNEQE